MNAALQAAKAKLEARRGSRERSSYTATVPSRHQPLERASMTAGQNNHGDRLYFIVLYCPGCLRGQTIELVRDPGDLPDARELGLKQMRPWRVECAEAKA
jgi:hypothetical protein